MASYLRVLTSYPFLVRCPSLSESLWPCILGCFVYCHVTGCLRAWG